MMTPFSSVQPHSVHGIFPDGTEKHFGTLQGRLGRAALGDVADMQQQRRLAVIFHPAGTHFDRDDAAVAVRLSPSIQVSLPLASF